MEWSKRKFRMHKGKPPMRICEMNLEEAKEAEDCFHKLSCAAGYANDTRAQNHWTSYELEAKARIAELEKAQ